MDKDYTMTVEEAPDPSDARFVFEGLREFNRERVGYDTNHRPLAIFLRDEANAIGTAYMRSVFLVEPDRRQADRLFREYVDLRVAAVQSLDPDQVQKALNVASRIQRQLWDMAVVNARKDMNSDVAALYIESLNGLINLHARG